MKVTIPVLFLGLILAPRVMRFAKWLLLLFAWAIVIMIILAWGIVDAADSVKCTTKFNEVFKEWRVECTDGSRSVTKWNRVFQEWRTEVVTPGAANAVIIPKDGRK